MCGASIEPNLANMCAPCLSNEVDISEGISKEGVLVQCRGCLRFQRHTSGKSNTGVFTEAPLESLELMSLCLKKIHGLNKDVKLVDASFIWTEPHSKRVKLKLTIQKEVCTMTRYSQSRINSHDSIDCIIGHSKCDFAKVLHRDLCRREFEVP
jgi:nonsense-mediated mRNA decay protein 3